MQTDAGRSRPGRKTALMVVDLQQALCDLAPPDAMEKVIARIEALVDWAETHSWPIVLVQHRTEPGTILDRGSAGWQLARQLRDLEPAFHLEKTGLSCFEDGRLHAWLAANGISRLCIAGMQTEYCITAACQGAVALGYEVVLPTDAHMTIDGPEKPATEIVAEANERLRALAQCVRASEMMAGG